MARFAWVVVALALLLPLSACGSGGGGGGFFGVLEVCNEDATLDTITYIEVTDEFGVVDEFPLDIFPGECVELGDYPPGFYDVYIEWDFGPSPTLYANRFVPEDDVETVFADNGD